MGSYGNLHLGVSLASPVADPISIPPAREQFSTLQHNREVGEDSSVVVTVPQKLKSASAKPLSASAAKLRLLKRLHCTLKFEKKVWQRGARLVAGVDEVGRGSLFGPVVAAAVILDPEYRIRGLRDSKLLPAERRQILAERIR